jgi:uncharacterized protein YceK
MDARTLALLLPLALLTGCGSIGSVQDPQEALVIDRVTQLMTAYNAAHGTHYDVPQVVFDDSLDRPSEIAAADYSRWTLHFNRLWLVKSPCMLYKEAVPHELAHLVVDYQKYGRPQTVLMNTTKGAQLVAMNTPPLQDSADEHGRAWQDVASSMGANPCKEGYCRDPRPYSKYPMRCIGSLWNPTSAQPALAAAPAAPRSNGGR